MAEYIIQEETLTNISNAVRTKTEKTDLIPVSNLASEILSITSFSGAISITYPSGFVCTCSDGISTFTSPDTSGNWICIVPNAGDWNVKCTDNYDRNDEKTVSIDINGESKFVELTFWDGTIYDAGNEYTEYTGGIQLYQDVSGSYESPWGSAKKNSNNIVLSCYKPGSDSANGWGCMYTKNKINLKSFSKVSVTLSACQSTPYLAVYNVPPTSGNTLLSHIARTNIGVGTYTLDISSIDYGYIAVFALSYNPGTTSATITNVKLL